jgi:hypothetical protein
MTKTFDLNQVSNARSPLYRSFFAKLNPGDPIGISTVYGSAEMISNGFVEGIQRVGADIESVWVTLPRITTVPRGLSRPPQSHIAIDQPSATPVRKGQLKRGAPMLAFEVYPNGASVMVSGSVDGLIADAFAVGKHWFDYGSTQDGKRRKLTALGGR